MSDYKYKYLKYKIKYLELLQQHGGVLTGVENKLYMKYESLEQLKGKGKGKFGSVAQDSSYLSGVIYTRGIVLQYLQKNGNELKFVPEELKEDIEIIKSAVRKNPEAIVFASSKLKFLTPDIFLPENAAALEKLLQIFEQVPAIFEHISASDKLKLDIDPTNSNLLPEDLDKTLNRLFLFYRRNQDGLKKYLKHPRLLFLLKK